MKSLFADFFQNVTPWDHLNGGIRYEMYTSDFSFFQIKSKCEIACQRFITGWFQLLLLVVVDF